MGGSISSAPLPCEEAEASSDTYWPRKIAYPVAGGPIHPGPIHGLGERHRVAQPTTFHPVGGGANSAAAGGPAAASTYSSSAPTFEWKHRPLFPAAASAFAPPVGGPNQTDSLTMVIWDWDDTLMCSSAINSNQLQWHQAQQLESLLEQVLTFSMRLGETCVVTNADELWVLESTRRFAPRVLPLLSQISVISARRKYERSWPGDVFAWKRETFREILSARPLPPSGCLNLVVLGDSPAEMEAAQTATLGLQHHLVIKTVKFKEAPTVEELLEQLRVVSHELGVFVADEKSCCRNLVNWMRPTVPMPHHLPPTAVPYSSVSPTLLYNPQQLLPSPHAVPTSGAYLSNGMIYVAGQ